MSRLILLCKALLEISKFHTRSQVEIPCKESPIMPNQLENLISDTNEFLKDQGA